MGRKGMAEQVRVNVFFQSRPLADRAYNALNGTRLERLIGRFTAHKQAGAALAGYHILLHHQAGANGKIHLPILITLAGDAHRAADEVKIGSAELRDLAQTAAGGYQKFHECLFAVAPAGIAQAFQFFDGQRLSGTLLVQLERLDFAMGFFFIFSSICSHPKKARSVFMCVCSDVSARCRFSAR